MTRLIAFLIVAVAVVGCNDPVNPTPDDSDDDDDRNPPRQGSRVSFAPDAGPPPGVRFV